MNRPDRRQAKAAQDIQSPHTRESARSITPICSAQEAATFNLDEVMEKLKEAPHKQGMRPEFKGKTPW